MRKLSALSFDAVVETAQIEIGEHKKNRHEAGSSNFNYLSQTTALSIWALTFAGLIKNGQTWLLAFQ